MKLLLRMMGLRMMLRLLRVQTVLLGRGGSAEPGLRL